MTVEGKGEENDKNETRHHYKIMKKKRRGEKHDGARKMSHFLLPRRVDISSWGSKQSTDYGHAVSGSEVTKGFN